MSNSVPVLNDQYLQSALITGLARLNESLKAVLFQLPEDKKDPVRRVVADCVQESRRLYDLTSEWSIAKSRDRLGEQS